MKLYKKLLFAAFAAVGLSLASCSDKGDEPNGGDDGDYEIDYYATSVLQRPWKITEHEYSGKSYYTKDFETSWVINQAFRANGRTYTPFSYKLSLQSEVHYVEEVEVRDYPDEPELVICDSNTGQRIFTIEEYYDGGNYYVMIVRDRQGNRFRCESRDNAKMFFATNVSSYETLSLAYKTLIASDGDYKTIDYTVKALPRKVTGAYAIMLEDNSYAVAYDVVAPDGATKFQTSSELALGFNNGDITDEGFVGGGDEPGPTPSGEYDTVAEDILKDGVFVSDNGWGDKFLINAQLDGAYYPLTACVDGKYIYYAPEIRVRNCDDGTRWLVMKNQPLTRIYRLIDYAADGSSITIAASDTPDTPIVLDRQTDCLVHFYNNETSYESFRVELKQVAVGGVNSDTNHWQNPQVLRNYNGMGALPVKWYDQSKPLTITSTIYAYNATDPENGVEFEYTSTVEPGSSMFARTIITDDDIPHEPTKEEIAALEAKLWQNGSATAWKISESCKDGEGYYTAHEPYGWIITERNISLEQGFHFADKNNGKNVDGNYYIVYENGKLMFRAWNSTSKSFQILTPINKILATGEMEVLFSATKTKYKCRNVKRPLIGYLYFKNLNASVSYVTVSHYIVDGYNDYGRQVYYEIVSGFGGKVQKGKSGAFALLADEEIAESTGAIKFHIGRSTDGGWRYYVADAQLGSVINIDDE